METCRLSGKLAPLASRRMLAATSPPDLHKPCIGARDKVAKSPPCYSQTCKTRACPSCTLVSCTFLQSLLVLKPAPTLVQCCEYNTSLLSVARFSCDSFSPHRSTLARSYISQKFLRDLPLLDTYSSVLALCHWHAAIRRGAVSCPLPWRTSVCLAMAYLQTFVSALTLSALITSVSATTPCFVVPAVSTEGYRCDLAGSISHPQLLGKAYKSPSKCYAGCRDPCMANPSCESFSYEASSFIRLKIDDTSSIVAGLMENGPPPSPFSCVAMIVLFVYFLCGINGDIVLF